MLRHIGKINLISIIINAIAVFIWHGFIWSWNYNLSNITGYINVLIFVCLFDSLSLIAIKTGKRAFSIICGIGIIMTNIFIWCFMIMCCFGFKMDGWDYKSLMIFVAFAFWAQFGIVRGIFTIIHRKRIQTKEFAPYKINHIS